MSYSVEPGQVWLLSYKGNRSKGYHYYVLGRASWPGGWDILQLETGMLRRSYFVHYDSLMWERVV